MTISKTNKKILIFGVFFILFTIITAVAFRYENKEEPVLEMEFTKDYKVEESGLTRVLESKEAGFSLSIPENWIVKEYGYKIGLLSSELKYEAGVNPLDQAQKDKICMVNVQIIKYKENNEELTDFSSLMSRVERGETKEYGSDFGYSLVNVAGRVFLVATFKKDGQTIYISARTRDSNNIYYIDSGLAFSEECAESFNSVLQTVKIEYGK